MEEQQQNENNTDQTVNFESSSNQVVQSPTIQVPDQSKSNKKPASMAYLYAFLCGTIIPILSGLICSIFAIAIIYLFKIITKDIILEDSTGYFIMAVGLLLVVCLPWLISFVIILKVYKYLNRQFVANHTILVLILIITVVVSSYFWKNTNPLEGML